MRFLGLIDRFGCRDGGKPLARRVEFAGALPQIAVGIGRYDCGGRGRGIGCLRGEAGLLAAGHVLAAPPTTTPPAAPPATAAILALALAVTRGTRLGFRRRIDRWPGFRHRRRRAALVAVHAGGRGELVRYRRRVARRFGPELLVVVATAAASAPPPPPPAPAPAILAAGIRRSGIRTRSVVARRVLALPRPCARRGGRKRLLPRLGRAGRFHARVVGQILRRVIDAGADRGGAGSLAALARLDPVDPVLRRDHRGVRLEADFQPVALFDRREGAALAVQDVDRDAGRQADLEGGGAGLDALLLDAAQDAQRGGFGRTDEAAAAAMRAFLGRHFGQRRPQALARQFQKSEGRDASDLDARAVVAHRLLESPLDLTDMAVVLHVDEVDDDQPGQVAQPDLPCHLVGGFQIGLERRLLDMALARGPA